MGWGMCILVAQQPHYNKCASFSGRLIVCRNPEPKKGKRVPLAYLLLAVVIIRILLIVAALRLGIIHHSGHCLAFASASVAFTGQFTQSQLTELVTIRSKVKLAGNGKQKLKLRFWVLNFNSWHCLLTSLVSVNGVHS